MVVTIVKIVSTAVRFGTAGEFSVACTAGIVTVVSWLKGVYLSGIQFSGSVEFCESVAAFDSLKILDLALNLLSGLGGLKAANVVDLSPNWLNGNIPDEIGETAIRANKNRVANICNENGERFEGDQMPKQFVNHFDSFLGVYIPTQIGLLDEVKFMKIVSNEDALDMIRSVNDEEIKHAMFNIDNNKAPGPDGYSSKFFKQAWNVSEKDICLAVK
ncbi:RNA-directed DNA polymerase, eukaryota, reverse transcriptase zinc-binding domain protein [Tanacetum coccineum]